MVSSVLQHGLNASGFNSGCQRLREKGILEKTGVNRSKSLFSKMTVTPVQVHPKVSRIGLEQGGWLELENPILVTDAVKLLRTLS